MKYFFDTEFSEEPGKPIQLISIGIVADDGRELYIENEDIDLNALSPWLKENVVPYLLRSGYVTKGVNHNGHIRKHKEIGSMILNFVGADIGPQFWGYFVAYDWVLFCQLYGRMIDMPEILPHHAYDLKQALIAAGIHHKPAVKVNGPTHNALVDARWNKAVWEALNNPRKGP